VLLEDFQTAYAQISAGQPVQLPPKTTSFKYWAQRLENYAQSAEVREELAYWHALAERPARPLPVDFPGGENRERRAHTIGVALTEAETEALLRDVPAAYRTEINEVLLTALAVALSEWTGDTRVLIDLEGHGREDLFEDVDLSRTVGWFTTVYPVMLDLTGAQGVGEQVKAVKEQLRAVPRRGIGYGLLRYLSEDDEVRARLANVPQPQIAFNYLGQFDQMLGGANGDANSFGPAPEPRGPERDPNGLRRYLIEINGGVSQGCLRLEWTYSRALYQQETIERVARAFIDTLRGIIEHSRAPEAASLTPSDFPLADLDQKKLDKLLSKLK
ncbi:MAG TPA: condensation domain-containing protein, partial [Aggregatilineales bacterium]|nr:condensation domain-containing protein [Aggregatilineales bacterium]